MAVDKWNKNNLYTRVQPIKMNVLFYNLFNLFIQLSICNRQKFQFTKIFTYDIIAQNNKGGANVKQ